MDNFSWFTDRKDNDKWDGLIALFLFAIFLIWRAIINSGHLLLFVVCLIAWIVLYYAIEYIQKKKVAKPASLWKEYEKKYPIIVQYTPPKWINPAEAWLLYNCSVEPTDLTSLIYQWKFEKLIDIKTFTWSNSKREYIKLIKKDDLPLTRPLFESEIFDSIFRMWDVKIIEWPFQLKYALMLEDLEYHWIHKWWLVYKGGNAKKEKIIDIGKNQFWKTGKNKISVETLFFWIYFFIAFIFAILEEFDISTKIFDNFSLVELFWGIILIPGIGISTILLFWKMDWRSNLKYTEKWAKLASEIIGYSEFIKSCDENKIKLLVKEDPLFIDRTLPYATAFWMETEFLKKISPLKKDWNARYVRWQKVPSWIKIFRIFVRDDNSLL